MAQLPMQEEQGQLLARLAATLASLDLAQPQPHRLGLAVARLTGAEGAALTFEYASDSRMMLCATDNVVGGLENLQEVLGQGPGYRATNTRQIVVADFGPEVETRWPVLAQAVHEQYGPLSVYAIPIFFDGGLTGVATLYTWPRKRMNASLQQAQFLINAVGAALLGDFHRHAEDDGGLGEVWNSRAIVHQATGMVMAQIRCAPHDALTLLRGHAYAQETDIYDIATRVIHKQTDFSHFYVEGE